MKCCIIGQNILKIWINRKVLANRVSFFGLAGVASNSINVLIFWFCIEYFEFSPLQAGTCAYFSGMLVGFYINHKFTFKSENRITQRLLSYILIQIFIFIIYSILNMFFITNTEFLAVILHVGLILFCAILNFCLTSYIWNKYAKT